MISLLGGRWAQSPLDFLESNRMASGTCDELNSGILRFSLFMWYRLHCSFAQKAISQLTLRKFMQTAGRIHLNQASAP